MNYRFSRHYWIKYQNVRHFPFPNIWNLLLLHLMVLVFLELLFLLISTFIFFYYSLHLVSTFKNSFGSSIISGHWMVFTNDSIGFVDHPVIIILLYIFLFFFLLILSLFSTYRSTSLFHNLVFVIFFRDFLFVIWLLGVKIRFLLSFSLVLILQSYIFTKDGLPWVGIFLFIFQESNSQHLSLLFIGWLNVAAKFGFCEAANDHKAAAVFFYAAKLRGRQLAMKFTVGLCELLGDRSLVSAPPLKKRFWCWSHQAVTSSANLSLVTACHWVSGR